MDETWLVQACDLSCDYGNGRGLFRVNICIGHRVEGQVVGVLGPNGAGKTTLLNLLLGRQVRTAGELTMALPSKDCGYLPNTDYFFEFLSARENLDYLSHLKTGDARGWDFLLGGEWDLASRLQIADHLDRPVHRLSSGELRKVQVIASLIGSSPGSLASLVVWDEPHNNLDIVSNLELGRLLGQLRSANTLVVVTSHVVQSLENLLDQVIFLRDGRLIAQLSAPFNQDLTGLFLKHCLPASSPQA